MKMIFNPVKRIVLITLIAFFGIFSTVYASQSRTLIFPVTGTWYVCQGYRTSEITHKGLDIYAFDLTTSKDSYTSGTYGCSSKTKGAATGAKVYAPGNGTVTYITGHPDIMQLKLTTGGCFRIGHLSSLQYKAGNTVKQGQWLGNIAGPNSANGNYAHLHISVYSDSNCTKPVPFTNANNFQLYGIKEFPNSGIAHQYRGTAITFDLKKGMDLDSYCKSKGYTGVMLTGSTVNSWRCVTKLKSFVSISNMSDVCKWQFGKVYLNARYSNYYDPFSWKCYFN
ncbi:hypothetical protein SDC9_117658 [bioreactor metagenome]|uniref:M23ase beta-sheet core domain-containing protein n=1 Tax=bioreactor metagenome TaxID=1076179 RepID=A0A645BYX8_9ZZZZ